jgi:excisionase family DNA binding protein
MVAAAMQSFGTQVMILATVVGSGFYTYVEAARVLGVPLSHVNKKIASGELRRQRHGNQWMVTASSVEKLLNRETAIKGSFLCCQLRQSSAGSGTLSTNARRPNFLASLA